ncbi:MAG: hypothetical protein LBE01_05925, partial [Deltaproteobacteria bacterium]|nr:hypothetical protein [Deltaproteobacteria bacterium]
MKLLIVETAAEAKKIESFLDPEWSVAALGGRVLRALPRRDILKQAQLLPSSLTLTEHGERVVHDLRPLSTEAQEVYLGLRPDDDGELNAFCLKEILGLENPRRVVFAEISKKTVLTAIKESRPLNVKRAQAREAYWIGERLAGLVAMAIQAQTGQYYVVGLTLAAALGLLIEWENRLEGETAVTNFGIELTFAPEFQRNMAWRAYWNPKNWLAEGESSFRDRKMAQKIAEVKSVEVVSHKEGRIYQRPAPPFTTSTLLRSAADSLFFDPGKTMELAQALHEGGYITFPRTASQYLRAEVVDEIKALAESYGWPLAQAPRDQALGSPVAEGVECVRPVNLSLEAAGDSNDLRTLYKLIRLRTIASQMTDAVYNVTQAVLWAEVDGKKAFFEAKSRRLFRPGHKALLNEEQAASPKAGSPEEDLNNPIPRLTPQAKLSPLSGRCFSKEPNGLSRLSKAALIDELEKLGVGRSGDYAPAVAGLVKWGYATADNRGVLRSTAHGQKVWSLLADDFKLLGLYGPGSFGEALKNAVVGEGGGWLSAVASFRESLEAGVAKFGQVSQKTCPDCGEPIWRAIGQNGVSPYAAWFCPNPECGGKFMDDGGAPGPRRLLQANYKVKCGNCGGWLALVKGHKSYEPVEYWACQNKEACAAKYRNDNGSPGELFARLEISAHACPDCGAPIQRREEIKDGRSSVRWFCSNRRGCGARYKNDRGAPGERLFPADYRHLCPDC